VSMAKAVGTAVSKRPSKWHCLCLMTNGKEVFITVKAETAVSASEKVHAGYAVEYVLDIYTHEQMERKKAYLKPSIMGAIVNY
jgi:hypothetical protein